MKKNYLSRNEIESISILNPSEKAIIIDLLDNVSSDYIIDNIKIDFLKNLILNDLSGTILDSADICDSDDLSCFIEYLTAMRNILIYLEMFEIVCSK